jgi:hypothetical protein
MLLQGARSDECEYPSINSEVFSNAAWVVLIIAPTQPILATCCGDASKSPAEFCFVDISGESQAEIWEAREHCAFTARVQDQEAVL